jgi:hypothetical protein
MANRFAAGCARCSVLVLPGGGFLREEDNAWEVWCTTCHHLDVLADADDFDPDEVKLPANVPAGCAAYLSLRVLGLTRACWKCGLDTVCLIGLYPTRPGRGYVGVFTTDSEKTMDLVRRLVQRAGRPDLAAAVKDRYSKTTRTRQLTNGCRHCDAIQGNFPVHEEATERVASGGVDGLDTLLVTDCPVLEWQAIVYDNAGGVICV